MTKKQNTLPTCVIGSGLSAISACKALEKTGKSVLILDVGLVCEKKIQDDIYSLAEKPAWKWNYEDRLKLRKGFKSSSSGVKEKLQYGSNYSSKNLDNFPIRRINSKFYTSFARGGLSNIWGAGLLPMHQDDMTDGWPVSIDELLPHYKSVLKFVPMAGRHDSLEELLPLYCKPTEHSLSRQATTMLARMEKNSDKIHRRGFYFGASRLAGRFCCQCDTSGCHYCSMCLYGCPYGVLYSAKDTLAKLLQNQNFSYRPNYVVTHLVQGDDEIKIYGTDTNGRQQETIRASKVILACGAPATTKIILSSFNLYNKPIRMATSDQYYIPLLSFAGQPYIEHEKMHTMCQSFWVMKNQKISPHLLHFSVYTYNDLYRQVFQSMLGKVYPFVKGLINIPLQRLYFMFCYLHSKDSGLLTATLANDAKKSLTIEGTVNPESKFIFNNALRNIKKLSKYTGLHPVPFYKGTKLPGGGNHFGGSFPMSKNPSGLQTDLLGRIKEMPDVHIVDSSVFPEITATTITLSVMANAHRIASNIY